MTTSISAELRGLFHYVTEARLPTAGDFEAYFHARGLSIKPAGPNLERPPRSTNGTLQEVEAVTGPLSKTIPRGSRYETMFVRVVIRGQRIAVNVAHDNGAVKSVNVQF